MHLHCPRCRRRPQRVVVLRSGIPVCDRCGNPCEVGRPLALLPALGALALGGAMALALVPRSDPAAEPAAVEMHRAPPNAAAARLSDPTAAAVSLQPQWLLSELAIADRQWIPRSEPLPDGGVRYHYKRRSGEPELELEQIHALIADPPSYAMEQRQISSLLLSLQRAGVQVSLSEPRKPGAAAEWDPAGLSLRIHPRVVAKGSLDFARVLNHEAIHVAQSCRGGGIAERPRPLGLSTTMAVDLESHLHEPVYAQASSLERQLEREAYANQHNLELGLTLLHRHCQLPRL